MKKMLCFIVLFASAALLSASIANASSLEINVDVANPVLSLNGIQQITATSNEDGWGILLVIQPATGAPWADFLNSHPALNLAWLALPSDIQTLIDDAIGDKIVSYKLVQISGDGGSETYDFPSADFTGINGVPSTTQSGMYKVLFAFVAITSCFCVQGDFACNTWFVVPESPLGTAMAIVSPMAAVGLIALYKRRKTS